MIAKFRNIVLSAPFSVLENWTAKIELCLRRGLVSEALESLAEIAQPLRKGGYPEEFVRLAVEVLGRYAWKEEDPNLVLHDTVHADLIETLAYLGRFAEADNWLDRLEATIVGRTSRYILLCHSRAYRYWLASEFGDAKKWARRGVDLKSSGGLDTKYDCGHTLALAQRDSGEVAAALKYFLGGELLESVVGTSIPNPARPGQFFGNIGRCLHEEIGENARRCEGQQCIDECRMGRILDRRDSRGKQRAGHRVCCVSSGGSKVGSRVSAEGKAGGRGCRRDTRWATLESSAPSRRLGM
jgi:hypothetical protein